AVAALNLTVVGGGVLQPVNPDGTSVFRYGSTIPVKAKFADCDGSLPGDLALAIGLVQLSGNEPGGEINEPVSTSGADEAGFMRFSAADQQYIYNLATKPLPDPTASYQIVLTVAKTGQQVTAQFGLK
ncbi:MAG TPA: PxKF domain-containing protein, partial [Anaeromyxobacter sp.]|nr:PxKF domain-containing protein [Anaeromyxobacter sp.]